MSDFGRKLGFFVGHAILFEVELSCELISTIGDYATRTIPKIQKAYHDAFDPDPEPEENPTEE